MGAGCRCPFPGGILPGRAPENRAAGSSAAVLRERAFRQGTAVCGLGKKRPGDDLQARPGDPRADGLSDPPGNGGGDPSLRDRLPGERKKNDFINFADATYDELFTAANGQIDESYEQAGTVYKDAASGKYYVVPK